MELGQAILACLSLGLPGRAPLQPRRCSYRRKGKILDAMDYYNLLGVKRTARTEEIRAAFRRLAKRAHPDAHPHLSGQEKLAMHRQFIQLAHAYETLADPTRRLAYDRQYRPGAKATPRTAASASGGGSARPRRGAATTTGQARRARGAHQARRAAPTGDRARGSSPPPGARNKDELDDLMQDVQQLLYKFGLDLRQQFGQMLDKALDWALSVFVEVVTVLETNKSEAQSGQPDSQPPPSQPPPKPGAASAGPKPRAQKPPPEPPPNLDDELAALKQQVRNSGGRPRGRAPSSESVEEALQQIKERGGREKQ